VFWCADKGNFALLVLFKKVPTLVFKKVPTLVFNPKTINITINCFRMFESGSNLIGLHMEKVEF
jgi:hypothetical protein